jgi:peptide/nickel transport system permease protein
MSQISVIEPVVRPRRRLPLTAIVCLVILVVIVACAIAGSLIAPQSASLQNLLITARPPSPTHWLGTDQLGRDVFARIIVGARTAVIGPLVIALGAMVIGSALGLTAGYAGGRVDSVIMRWVDLMCALPPLLIGIVVVGVLGGGYWLAVLSLLVLTAPYDTRIIRGGTLEQRGLPYVQAAQTVGVRTRNIVIRHIWPNLLPLIIANSFLNFAFSLVSLSSLSFLGLGVPPGTPDWGRMLSDGIAAIFSNPVEVIAPAVAIALTATSMNLIGDWMFERLSARGRSR